jgi:hypothetical protein
MGSTKVEAPKPRDYKQEMLDAMSAQEQIQPRLLELERQYQPLYQRLQQEMMDRQMEYQLDSYGKAIPKSAELSGRFADAMAPVYSRMGQQAQEAYRAGVGAETMGLYDKLLASAGSDLDAGRNLTPEMRKQAEQSARAAMAARGLTGNQAIMAEVLTNYGMGQDREDRARQFAANVYGFGQGNFQNAMGTYGQQFLGQSSQYSPAMLYNSAYGMSQGLGAQIFQPESQYNANLVTANQSNEMQARMATAANKAAVTGAIIGGVSKVAAAGVCWVAREVYGINNINWVIFRNWLLNDAPATLREFYIENGERFAKFISNKPFVKNIVRSLMDIVVKSEKAKIYKIV